MFLGIIIVVLFVLFAFTCYKKAPPTAAIVVTGFGLKKPKVVCGKGTFVIPVLQRADKLNMRLLKIDVKTPETGVKTKEGVSLWIDSVVTIQVYSDNSTALIRTISEKIKDDFKTSYFIFMGGGSAMMRESIERAIDTKNLFFLTDVTANAKGYEIMARAKLTMSGEI